MGLQRMHAFFDKTIHADGDECTKTWLAFQHEYTLFLGYAHSTMCYGRSQNKAYTRAMPRRGGRRRMRVPHGVQSFAGIHVNGSLLHGPESAAASAAGWSATYRGRICSADAAAAGMPRADLRQSQHDPPQPEGDTFLLDVGPHDEGHTRDVPGLGADIYNGPAVGRRHAPTNRRNYADTARGSSGSAHHAQSYERDAWQPTQLSMVAGSVDTVQFTGTRRHLSSSHRGLVTGSHHRIALRDDIDSSDPAGVACSRDAIFSA